MKLSELKGEIMKLVLVVGMSFWLTGCGGCARTFTKWTGELTYKCSKSGVEYVQADSGIAVHVDGEGNPVRCSED